MNKEDSKKSPKDMEMSEKGANNPNDYDPYENRQVEHPTTFMETMFHLLKGSFGTGILAMPKAFNNAGYMIGSIGTALIGLTCAYCIHLLVDAQYQLCVRKKEPLMTYPDIATNAFQDGPKFFQKCSPYIGTIVTVFLLLFQLGTCCVYVVFVSTNIKSVADNYMENQWDVRIYMVIILIPLILINYIRNLKVLAPFSGIANAITFITFCIICYYIFREPVTTDGKHAAGSVQGLALFFGTVLFALEAIGIMLPLENEMKRPQKYKSICGILNIGFTIIVVVYVCMGLFGYLRFGDDIKDSITLNLPSNDLLAHSVKLLLALAIYVTHGLACFVAVDIIWKQYCLPKIKPEQNQLLLEYLLRTALVILTFIFAVAVPNLGLFISLVGAFCLSSLGLAFPALIQILIYYKEKTGFGKFWLYFSNIFLIIVALLGMIIGTAIALKDIIKTFAN